MKLDKLASYIKSLFSKSRNNLKFYGQNDKPCYNITVYYSEYKERGSCIMDVLTLSKYVIQKSIDDGKPITNLKLQKILYYIQGYFLRKYGERAFVDEICNWPYGPVVPAAYFEYNSNGSREITLSQPYEQKILTKDKLRYVDSIIEACMPLTARQLVEKTHHEDPWIMSQLREVIPESYIRNYFRNHDPLGICNQENNNG